MTKFLKTVFLLLAVLRVSGASKDSLENLLSTKLADSTRIEVLIKLSNEYRNSDTDKSVFLAQQAIALSKKTNRIADQGKAFHTLGTLYYLRARYPEALSAFLSSVKIREELKDSANLAKGYNNIALVHFEQLSFDEALKFHQKSIAIKQRRKDQAGLASSYGNVGNIYHKIGSDLNASGKSKQADSVFVIAYKYQEQSKGIQEKLVASDPSNSMYQLSLAASYNNLGNILYERALISGSDSQMKDALLLHQKALLIQERYNDFRGMSHSHINAAAIYDKLHNYEKALKEFRSALVLADSLGMREEKKVIYRGMSTVFETLGDLKQSLEYFKLFSSEKDSIHSVAKQEQISELQEAFNTKDREREIQLLNKNSEVAAAELEKEKLKKRSVTFGFILASVLVITVIALLFILWNRYKLKEKTSQQLELQNQMIGLKNKEITDSIRYAKKIQNAFLPPDQHVQRIIPDSFIFYSPKDIVSGDFYWVEEWGSKILIAVVDCTGHGVPGAFMSVVGYNLLNQAVNVYGLDKPSLILNHMNKAIYKVLHQSEEDFHVKDGMDVSLIAIDKYKLTLEFSGAFRPLWIVRKNHLEIIKGDKFPVGAYLGNEHKYTLREFQLMKGDRVYLFSDGYADQFGGPKGKKFKYNTLASMVQESDSRPMHEEGKLIENAFNEWKGNYEQIDDVCMLGVRV